VEFSYNNASGATTGVFPFFANEKYHPNISIYPEYNIALSSSPQLCYRPQ